MFFLIFVIKHDVPKVSNLPCGAIEIIEMIC